MAKCSECRVETSLHYSTTPICENCDDKLREYAARQRALPLTKEAVPNTTPEQDLALRMANFENELEYGKSARLGAVASDLRIAVVKILGEPTTKA
jgi:hypothetical protein